MTNLSEKYKKEIEEGFEEILGVLKNISSDSNLNNNKLKNNLSACLSTLEDISNQIEKDIKILKKSENEISVDQNSLQKIKKGLDSLQQETLIEEYLILLQINQVVSKDLATQKDTFEAIKKKIEAIIKGIDYAGEGLSLGLNPIGYIFGKVKNIGLKVGDKLIKITKQKIEELIHSEYYKELEALENITLSAKMLPEELESKVKSGDEEAKKIYALAKIEKKKYTIEKVDEFQDNFLTKLNEAQGNAHLEVEQHLISSSLKVKNLLVSKLVRAQNSDNILELRRKTAKEVMKLSENKKPGQLLVTTINNNPLSDDAPANIKNFRNKLKQMSIKEIESFNKAIDDYNDVVSANMRGEQLNYWNFNAESAEELLHGIQTEFARAALEVQGYTLDTINDLITTAKNDVEAKYKDTKIRMIEFYKDPLNTEFNKS